MKKLRCRKCLGRLSPESLIRFFNGLRSRLFTGHLFAYIQNGQTHRAHGSGSVVTGQEPGTEKERITWNAEKTKAAMLITIFIFLLALWLLGMISSYTLGGYIHILLIIAVVVLLVRIIQGRNPL